MKCELPGTTLAGTEESYQNAFGTLEPVLSATKGLTLSQLHELTGLAGSTIQNWVKRGWVANPTTRRYGECQVVRVILINMLRNSLKLEKIISLMSYINGSVEDRGDDIIEDRELWNILCSVIFSARKAETTDCDSIRIIIGEKLEGYCGPSEDSNEKLFGALLCMTLAYISSEIKKEAEEELDNIIKA
ncbi:MAG: DUF1836 domain-containing protein [Oscillospiraceae bacterium]